jgi:hypothetical protein
MQLSNQTAEDLRRSGLSASDIEAREAGTLELAAIGLPAGTIGYVIPYYDLYGKPRPFYRVRLFGHSIKYMQPKNTSNHVYFPRNLQKAFNGHNYVVVCEGEKKAAACTKSGIPVIALGGVDSWKNRTLNLPEGSDLNKSYQGGGINVKLPSGAHGVGEGGLTIYANGLGDFIDWAVTANLELVIAFDTDSNTGLKYEVQRAAAALAFELRYAGIPFSHIHHLILPPLKGTGDEKVGLDDYLVAEGANNLQELIDTSIASGNFPRHPNVREYVARKLQNPKLSRKDNQNISMSILSDLDAQGKRLRSIEEGQMYYYANDTRKLDRVVFNSHQKGQLHETPFGQILYKRYGLSAADNRTLTWLDAQFNGEDPVEEVSPQRVIARPAPDEDVVRYQINDGQYARIDKDGITVHDNGYQGFMFEAGRVEPIEAGDLLAAVKAGGKTRKGHPVSLWTKVLDDVRLKDGVRNRKLFALLYYLSPWLNKWRGMQLPVELVVGEPGSGKSSLYEHRLNVVTGIPELRNAPTDLRDWHASIVSTGGIHVTDNVQLVDKNLKQRMSDEICRLITEPHPHIEQRKLYSNTDLLRIPVGTTFALTAIMQPFMNADLLQRAIIIELDKTEGGTNASDITYDSAWVPHQMQEYGGRVNWVAHHLLVLQRFFQIVDKQWDNTYKAEHRLINFEQALILMAEVFEGKGGGDWIPEYLTRTSSRNISESDWALEGLVAYAKLMRLSHKHKLDRMRFSSSIISSWAQGDEDFLDCTQLTNSRRLGRYIQTHKQVVGQLAGLHEAGKSNNKIVYRITPTLKTKEVNE